MYPMPQLTEFSEAELKDYAGLKPHPRFPFANGDRIRYKTFDVDDDQPLFRHCILIYAPDAAAFILVNYKDETFSELEDAEQAFLGYDFLMQIGIELLEKL